MNKSYPALIALIISTSAIGADTCMVSPTAKQEVSGRFGKFRVGGAANHGSGNAKPHMHDGLDFSTSGQKVPILATAAGTVDYAESRGSAGNTVMIKRDNGAYAVFYHLDSISVKRGDKIAAGTPVGISGKTGMGPSGATHLHFIYGVPQKDDARAKTYANNAAQQGLAAFNPAQLPSVLNLRKFGYATDPSPYFCKTFPIQKDGLESLLGADTIAQYTKLFGSTPKLGVSPDNGTLASVQVAAANADAVVAEAAGATTAGEFAAMMKDSDGYGALPPPPLGDYSSMSVSEMMKTEAGRRFSDSKWNTNITTVSSRALWVDYVRALGVANFMNERIYAKKERVEALLALYTSQKLANLRNKVSATQARAERDYVSRAIR